MNTSSSHLSAICFEHIKDDYWYGAYGEFRVVMMKTNGWINASKMCKDGGKQFSDWTRLQSTKQLLEAYDRIKASENTTDIKTEDGNTCGDPVRGIPGTGSNTLLTIKVDGFNDVARLIAGTYCPADLIPSVAGWISPEFQIKANRIINYYLVSEYKAALVASERDRARAAKDFDKILESCEADLDNAMADLGRTSDELSRTKGWYKASQSAHAKTNAELTSTKEKWSLDVDALWFTELSLDAVKQDLTRTQAARANTELALVQAGEACALERVEKNQALQALQQVGAIARTLQGMNQALEIQLQTSRQQSHELQAKVEHGEERLIETQIDGIKKETTMRKFAATHSFQMLQTNDADSKYPYYAVRCTRRHMPHAVKRLKRRHPNATTVYKQHYIPNAINFYQRLRDGGHIKAWHNYCDLTNGIVDFVQVMVDMNGGEAMKPSKLYYENGREYLI